MSQMTPESYSNWKNVYKDFLQSGRSQEEYCQEKGFSLKWFERQNRKAAGYEKRFPQGVPEEQKSPTQKSLSELFVELIPGSLKPDAVTIPQPAAATSGLKLTYREIVFELGHDFEESTFKRALRIVREAF